MTVNDELVVTSEQILLHTDNSNPFTDTHNTATPEQLKVHRRLTIKKMTLHNFKSYAGTVDIGPFHKSFSSIVGPNGSGKSNVIDAMLFVFGFKAKKMRQEKVSGLIHNSQSYPDLEQCSVQVHFHDIDDYVRVSSIFLLIIVRKTTMTSTK